MAISRLTKVAKEFNVGMQTIVEFLAKKGHQVEMNPNTKISEEQYQLLSDAFQNERKVKEEADKIELITGANRVVELRSKEKSEVESEEIIIKNYSAPKTQSVPEPDAQPEPEPVVESIVEPVIEPEPKPVAEPIAEPAPEEEPTATPEPEQPVQDNGPLKVLGTVDLSTLNQRTRPDKKKKGQKVSPEAAAKPKATTPVPVAEPKDPTPPPAEAEPRQNLPPPRCWKSASCKCAESALFFKKMHGKTGCIP